MSPFLTGGYRPGAKIRGPLSEGCAVLLPKFVPVWQGTLARGGHSFKTFCLISNPWLHVSEQRLLGIYSYPIARATLYLLLFHNMRMSVKDLNN